jgi:hypothetical protein
VIRFRRNLMRLSVGSLAAIATVACVATAVSASSGVDRTVEAEAACPSIEPRGVYPGRGTPSKQLVPAGVVQVLLCRYDGPFGDPHTYVAQRFRLVAGRTIADRASAGALAAQLDRLPAVPSGGFSCPGNGGAAIIGVFRLESGSQDTVRVNLTGCMTATNGSVVREAGLGDGGMLDTLEALLHAEPANPLSLRTGSGPATIDGHILLCGGPAPGRCFITSIGGCAPPDGCSESDRVIVIATSGEIVAEQHLASAHGSFRLHVAPGQYAVELLADGPRIHDRVLGTEGVTARAAATSTAIFQFAIP